MVSPEIEVWIKERDPGSAEEAARLVEAYPHVKGPELATLDGSPVSPSQVSPLGVVGVVKSLEVILVGSLHLTSLGRTQLKDLQIGLRIRM